jgi:hypothetical protein
VERKCKIKLSGRNPRGESLDFERGNGIKMREQFSFFLSPFLYGAGKDLGHLINHRKIRGWNLLELFGPYIGEKLFVMVIFI